MECEHVPCDDSDCCEGTICLECGDYIEEN